MSQLHNGMSAALLDGVVWRKSRFSNPSGNCVELAVLPGGGVAIRNSRDPLGPALIYTSRELGAFVRGIKGGDFDDLLATAD
ncbi:DUF397 domain-containing protein [Streptosporangium saharense]|uniref:DUF397 domain-containing protein n=1 Tax=Streptosporangium saharense TaxID=1706840 RepID=A0A7W7VRC6_9ACTN|nr:DUF397 domain-containing protein [Streptosporangium saharense]MBB4919947.1 hypothetical protein [Streptosporangium saharense]